MLKPCRGSVCLWLLLGVLLALFHVCWSDVHLPAIESLVVVSTPPLQTYSVDLPTILKLVERQNLILAQDQASVKESKGLLYEQLATFLPDITATYGQSVLKGGTQVFGGETFSVVRKTVQPQVAASWTLYPGGKTVFESLAAKQRKEVSQAQVTKTLQEQQALAATEYYALAAALSKRTAVEQAVEQTEAQAKAAQDRYAVGSGTKYDWMRAQAQQADQQEQWTQAHSNVILAQQALLNRLNLDSALNLILDSEPDAITLAALVEPTLPINTLKSYAKTHHPGVLRLNESLLALGWSRKSIWSDIVPSVTLRAYVGATGPSRDQLIRTDFQGITVTANALQSLGLQIPARLLTNKGVMERAVAERAALVRDVETQVTTAYQNSANYLAGIDAAKTGVDSAKEGARLATGRYTVGYGTNLEVVDAQAALVNARVRLAQAVFNYNQAQIQLVQALGLVSENTLVQGVPSDKVITHATP